MFMKVINYNIAKTDHFLLKYTEIKINTHFFSVGVQNFCIAKQITYLIQLHILKNILWIS